MTSNRGGAGKQSVNVIATVAVAGGVTDVFVTAVMVGGMVCVGICVAGRGVNASAANVGSGDTSTLLQAVSSRKHHCRSRRCGKARRGMKGKRGKWELLWQPTEGIIAISAKRHGKV